MSMSLRYQLHTLAKQAKYIKCMYYYVLPQPKSKREIKFGVIQKHILHNLMLHSLIAEKATLFVPALFILTPCFTVFSVRTVLLLFISVD